MSKEAGFFNFSIKKILSTDQSIFEQARIRLLYYGFWIVFIAVGGLFVSVYFQHKEVLTITAGIVLVCVI
ncbi:MAG TPA: hypothetical protein VGI43_18485, partial [Mucilaginibacter sp.]